MVRPRPQPDFSLKPVSMTTVWFFDLQTQTK